jgi:carbonic anhydrase/acetyltransferase-like protein (isoleucine patch superfamily)
MCGHEFVRGEGGEGGGVHSKVIPTLKYEIVCDAGHSVALESCTIKDECVIGMGSTIMEGAVVGRRSMVAAGSVVPAGAYIPPGQVKKHVV